MDVDANRRSPENKVGSLPASAGPYSIELPSGPG